jgi:hypothetical protein
VLVVTVDSSAAHPDGQTPAPAAPADVLRREIGAALARQTNFGTVTGIHLDVPFSPASAEAFGEVLQAVRESLPAALFLSISLRWTPPEKEREGVEKLARQVDALVAFVLGQGNTASPAATDALGRAWWAAYAPAARGAVRTAAGDARGTAPEGYLDRLVSDPRIEFGHDLSLGESSDAAFSLRARDALRLDGLSLEPGDQVSYSQPSLPEILFHLGADRAGRRALRGRLFVFEGPSDRDRIFTVSALEDVLLGRALTPDVRVETSVERRRSVRVRAENHSPHASLVSRVSNWVEVDLAVEAIADVEPGGFDRFEVYDREGRPVSLGRATRVRLYETLVAPLERFEPATISLRSAAPKGCCAHRLHIVSAAGPELQTDWTAPEAARASPKRP